jgi:hypothetical protein
MQTKTQNEYKHRTLIELSYENGLVQLLQNRKWSQLDKVLIASVSVNVQIFNW